MISPRKPILCAAVIATGLVGCATEDVNKQLELLKSSLSTGGQLMNGSNLASVSSTKLAGALRTTDLDAVWPRIALVDVHIPDVAKHFGAVLGPTDCMTFSAVMWYDMQRSEKYGPLALCPPEFVRGTQQTTATDWIHRWTNTRMRPDKSTEGQRTTGPTPPFTTIPFSPDFNAQMLGAGQSYMASLLLIFGWDPSVQSSSAKVNRVWIVNYQ